MAVYDTLKEELERTMKDSNVKLAKNRVKDKKGKINKNQIELTIKAKRQDDLRDSVKQLHTIVNGEHVQCSERQFRYFTKSRVGRELIAQQEIANFCKINMDYQLRELMIFGGLADREQVKRVLETKKPEVDIEEDQGFEERFDDKPTGFIKSLIKKYGVSLEKLSEETGVSHININYLRHVIEFRGEKNSLVACKTLMGRFVDEMLTSSNGGNSNKSKTKKKTKNKGSSRRNVKCPSCFDELGTASHQLEVCSHSYCKECFRRMCDQALKRKTLPILCIEDSCNQVVSLHDIIEFVELKEIVTIAVELLVAKDKYNHCVTPNCQNIYRVTKQPNPGPYICDVCHVTICRYCRTVFHTNLQCKGLDTLNIHDNKTI